MKKENIYYENDINKLNTINENKSESFYVSDDPYNINIETGLYEEIISRYRKIVDSLKLSKKIAKSSMITGELRTYYETITNGSEIDQNIDDIVKEIENIIIKIEISLKTYDEIDENLRRELDSIIGTIFSVDEIELGDSLTTIEERKNNLENIIKLFEDTLRIWQEEYNSLFKVDEKDTDKIFHLFDSLGLTQFSKEVIYNKETGSYNIKELAKMVNYLEKNKVSKIFYSYFKEDKSWQESGMDTFDENLKRDYWLYRNNNGYSEESNKNLDAEVLFLQNFMNSFGTNAGKTPGVIEGIDNLTSHVYLYGSYCQERYQGLKYFEDYFYTNKEDLQLNENFNLSFEEWLKEWEGTQEEYYITHQNELQLEGYNTFDEYLQMKKNTDSETSLDLITSCFSFGDTINGKYHFWYELNNNEENTEWTKESALIMIKSYVANQGGLEILDEASDIYDKKAELDKNIMSLQNTIYNYKQYSKLMIFDDDKKNEKYLTKYLTKNYDASYNNKFLPEEWLQYLDRSEVALLDYLYNEKDEYQAKKYVDAITDIVNQRKGFKEAVEYAESLNKENKFDENFANNLAMMNGDAGSYAASGLIWLVNKLFPDQVDKVIDTGIAGTEGFFDGNYNFIDGFYDMVNADGVRSAKDYEFMYKMQLLATNNEYTTNLTDKEKEWLNSVYQFGNSLGYMTIPTLLSYVPVVGNTLSYGALTISSSGNSAEDLMQQGVEKERAYLFGSLMGVSETAVEKLIGGLPGSPDNAGKGFLSLIKSSLGEAGEEAFQTYVSSGISSMATGEPFDVGSVTEEAKEAAFMAIFTSGFMNTGGSIFLKVADTVIETTPSKYNSYEEWRASIENDFRKNNSDIANNLMETQADTGELILNIPQEELNNIDGKQKEMISNLVYNTKTGEYQVTLINGNTFNVNNLDKVTNNVLISNLMNKNVSNDTLVQKIKTLFVKKSSDADTQTVAAGISGVLNQLQSFYSNNFDFINDHLKSDMSQADKSRLIKDIYERIFENNKDIKFDTASDLKIYRGISAKDKSILKQYVSEFVNGKMHFGTRASIYGTGVYICSENSKDVAKKYATDGYTNSNGAVVESVISSEANVGIYEEIIENKEKILSQLKKVSRAENYQTYTEMLDDNGLYASILGYDAMYVKEKDYFVVFNGNALKATNIELCNENGEFDNSVSPNEYVQGNISDDVIIEMPVNDDKKQEVIVKETLEKDDANKQDINPIAFNGEVNSSTTDSVLDTNAESKVNETPNKVDADISAGLDIDTPSQYSDYSLDQIINYQKIKDTFNKLFDLAQDEKTKSKLEEILYKGGIDGFSFSTKLSNSDNPSVEGQRRIAMANLLVTHPDTFNTLVENKINVFHGTSSAVLSSILTHGLNSGLESQQNGIDVLTGEEWSRGGEQRSFVSFTDLLDMAKGYSAVSTSKSKNDSDFEVVIATTTDDIKQEKLVRIHSDTPEIGVKSKLPSDKIKAIMVPSDKVEIVQNMIKDANIKVLAVDDSKDKFYSVDDMGLINISDDKFNKLKSTISQTTIDQKDNIESKEATDEQADEFVGPITIPNTLNEINKTLSSNLPTNYYKGNISISNNVYNIPIIHSDSSLDYSIVDLYPASHYIRVYADKGNIEQQIRAQLADISQKNNNQEQPNTTIDANTNSPEFIATAIDGETIPSIQEVGIKEVVSSNEENFENQTENVEPQVEPVTPTLQKGQPTNDEFKQVTFDSDVATDNVIIEPKVNEIQGTIVEQSNIKRDISLNSDVIRSIAHLNNSEVISKNSFSKTVADFIKRLDSDVSKLISSPNVMMPSTHSINPIIDSYGMYDSTSEVRNISIADIISSGQLKQDTNILSTFDDYFNTYDKNADSYHTRANSLLSYSNGESLINGIKNFSDTLDMKIREYQDGTYIIGSNGLHRYTILRFFYQLDLANGADVETLREKYTFPMTVTEKINYDNTFIKYFSHKLFDDLTWFTLDDETMSNSETRYKMFFKQDGGTKVIEMERSEILAKISDALQNKEKKYFSFLEFKENYLKYNNFQKFVDDNFPDLKNIILSFNEMPTFIDMEQNYIVDNIGFGANNSLADENNHVDVLDVPSLDDMIFDYEFVQPEQPFIDRNLVINEYSKSEFMDFLENDNSGQILKILDDEGLKILNNSRKKEERIRYILTHSKYKNELLINEKFLDIFLNTNVTSYYAVLSGLSFETYDKILERCIEGNFGNYIFVELFGFFDIDYQLKALENWKYSSELIYDVFKKFNIPVVKRILENYNINLLSHDINLEDLFYCAKESVLRAQASRYEYGGIIDEIKIPVNMVTNEMASILWNKYDIFRLRKIVNDANYSTDPSILNEYIKIQEEKIISEVLENKMTTQFLEIFNTFEKIKNLAYNDLNRYNLLEKYHELLISMNMMNENQNLERIYKNGGIDKVRDYLQKLSDRAVSNYIIDYHFEENFYNIMIDVRELLKFYNDGNINLSLERVELYQKIANIDSLSVLEKVELHNQLKNVAIMELFYDDMSLAREIVGEAIRDYSLTYESLKQYRNEHLSSQYGIDVYTIEDNPFFAVVKSNRRAPDLLPTGHSYSLIGYGGISVFGNVKDSSTFLYDSVNLKPEQIVHTFPYDSYTLYRPFRFNENATDRINLLMMPEELMANTETYNEILILERGKLSTEMDAAIPELKRMALYCIDEITEKDIKAAEIAGVGIFLVNSKNYYNPDDASLRNYQRHIDYYNSNYFDGVNKQKIEDNR